MITPFGRYRWLRLPFGLKVSSEIFQRRLNKNLENLKGVACISDDIIVAGLGEIRDEANRDLDKNVAKLKKRCSEREIQLNEEKESVRQTHRVYGSQNYRQMTTP